MLTQIYEVSTPSEADAISGLGIDHVGVLVGNGAFPRERSVREAAAILAAIRASSKSLALFLSADFALIEQLARELRPTLGTDSGVSPGQRLDVYRLAPVPVYLGQLIVTNASPKESIGRYTAARRELSVRAGDGVGKCCDRQEL